MNNEKNFRLIKILGIIIIVALVVIIVCVLIQKKFAITNKNESVLISSIQKKSATVKEISSYVKSLQDYKSYIDNMDSSLSLEQSKVNILNYSEQIRNGISSIGDYPWLVRAFDVLENQTLSFTGTSTADNNTAGLVKSLAATLTGLIANVGDSLKSFVPTETWTMTTDSNQYDSMKFINKVSKVDASKYNVDLKAKVYINDATSNKWVVLLHGHTMNGQTITDALGDMYVSQGYNILAPDLRGEGESGGGIALGFLDSLDVYDWIKMINQKYNASKIIVHGISLGSGTTVYLSGNKFLSDEYGENFLKNQNVIGLVDDCGFVSMTTILNDTFSQVTNIELIAKILGSKPLVGLIGIDVNNPKTALLNENYMMTGFRDDANFTYYQDGTKSLANSKLPLMVIHGTSDTIVNYDHNATAILDTAKSNTDIPFVEHYKAEGQSHAFITMGLNYSTYNNYVKSYIEKVEKNAQNDPEYKNIKVSGDGDSSGGFFKSVAQGFKFIKDTVSSFFGGLFS